MSPGRYTELFFLDEAVSLAAGHRPCAECRRERLEGRSAALVIIADEESVAAAYDSPAGVLYEKRGGLGLALPLARRVIERLGGVVWSPAEPEGLQKNAIVIRFPITE